MPVRDDYPRTLRVFQFHGATLSIPRSGVQANGDCPFCGKEGKFYASQETGSWDCKAQHCLRAGNPVQFLRLLREVSYDQTPDADYAALARERRLLDPGGLKAWGLCRSAVTGEWLAPGHGVGGKLDDLYVWRQPSGGKKRIMQASPGFGHALFGFAGYDPKAPTVYLCEGVWSGLALWELLSRRDRGGSTVLATPGANVFLEWWLPLFRGKAVVLCFDSDHPVGENGTRKSGAGWSGVRRVAALLRASDKPPKSVSYLRWGATEQWDAGKKTGYDVRDYLSGGW